MNLAWRSLRAIAALALVAATGLVTAAAPELRSERVKDQANALAWWGDLDGLERLYAEVNRPGRYGDLGNVLVHDFRRGIDLAFTTPDKVGGGFLAEIDAMTLEWARQRPMVPMVHWIHAGAVIDRAWEVRGSGFANTVAPQAWAEFRGHLERAVAHLASTAAVSMQDSSAYRELLTAGRGLGWDLRQAEQLAEAGRKRNPEDLSLWSQQLTSTLPKWGGSASQVDRLIRRAASEHKERGDEIYARLYLAAAEEEFSHTVFSDTAADWPRIRKGLRDSIQRWPGKAVFWNRLAYFACLKEDRETLTEALEAVGEKPDFEQWGRNGRRVFESCRKLARQG